MASDDDSDGASGEEEEEAEEDSLSTISLPNFLSVKRGGKVQFH